MSVRISELLIELSEFRIRQVSGSGTAEISFPGSLPAQRWEPEALYVLPPGEPLPKTPPGGTSCLIVMGERVLPPGFTEGGANILICPDPGAAERLHKRLSGLFADELAVAGAVARIYEALLRKQKPQAVLDAANQSLDLPMVISDYTHTIIAHTCPPELYGEPDWDTFIAHGVVPEFMGGNHSQIIRNLCETPGGTLRLTRNEQTGGYNLMGDVMFEGERIGRIAMGLPRGIPTRRETRILAVMVETLASLIGNNPQAGFVRGDIMEAFLTILIEGGSAAETFFMNQSAEVHYPHEGFFRIMIMDLDAHKPFRQSIRSIISYLEMICPGSISTVYGKTLVMLTNYQTKRTFDMRSEQELSGFISDYHVYCGTSREFFDMKDFAHAYSEALSALEISRYLSRPTPEGMVFRLAEYDACESMIEANSLYKAGEDLRRRCHPFVLRLREYDEEYGSAYFETLKTYLRYAQKTQITAEALCLHRNSLEYRLRKIKALTGLDWDDGDLMMRLTRSFVFLDFLDLAEGRANFLRDISPSLE